MCMYALYIVQYIYQYLNLDRDSHTYTLIIAGIR